MNDKILEALKTLADRLGTTAEYLWTVLVKQGKVDFIQFGILVILGLVFSVYFFYSYKKSQAKVGKERGEGKYGEMKFVTWENLPLDILKLVMLGMVALSFAVAAGATMGAGINGLLNPEYSALSKILRML